MFKLFGFSIFKPNETKFFMDVITTTLRDRIAKGESSRNDLIDMMIKAMKEDISELEEEASKEQFDLDSELKNHQVLNSINILWGQFCNMLNYFVQ